MYYLFYLHLYDTMFQALFKTTNINQFHTQQVTKTKIRCSHRCLLRPPPQPPRKRRTLPEFPENKAKPHHNRALRNNNLKIQVGEREEIGPPRSHNRRSALSTFARAHLFRQCLWSGHSSRGWQAGGQAEGLCPGVEEPKSINNSIPRPQLQSLRGQRRGPSVPPGEGGSHI
ncbi:uncharacterized protein AAES06_010297 isoform 1-T1 [Glossophaga mutica]